MLHAEPTAHADRHSWSRHRADYSLLTLPTCTAMRRGRSYSSSIRKPRWPMRPARQLHFRRGHAGLGIVLMSGWGDGTYTVMADTFVDEQGFTIIRGIRLAVVTD